MTAMTPRTDGRLSRGLLLLMSVATGLAVAGNYFAQPVFANGWLYTARIGGLVKAWHLP